MEQTKYWIEGNTIAAKQELKELRCRYDAESRRWFHTDPTVAREARLLVESKPAAAATEKFFVTGRTFDIRDQLKARGFRFDGDAKDWYHTDEGAAKLAQTVVDFLAEK